MRLSKFEGRMILMFQVCILHLLAIFSKLYLLKNKKLKKEMLLLEDMRGIAPIVFPGRGGTWKFGYLVKGTSLMLYPRYVDKEHQDQKSSERLKYAIWIGLPEAPWESGVKMEYILENYPERISENFLFNLNKFN